MSFSTQVKEELTKTEYEFDHCRRSFLYGLCIFAREFSSNSFLLQSENENLVKTVQVLLYSICNLKAEISSTSTGKKYKIQLKKKEDAAKLFAFFGHSKNDTSLQINVSNFECDECSNAFFAGAFLSCGNMSDPAHDYHLEFSIPFANLSKSFVTFLKELELEPKLTNRRGYHIIYFKVSEELEDVLYRMGASSAMFDLVNIKIEKDLRNQINRYTNYENANIKRMANAIAPQIEAIDYIFKEKGRDFLPDNLRYTAYLRYDNPDASLAELSELSNHTISKSGINHRLKKIIEIAEQIREEKG